MRAVIRFVGVPFSKQNSHPFFHNKNTGKMQFYSSKGYTDFKTGLAWDATSQLRKQGWKRVDEGPVWLSVKIVSSKYLGDLSNMIGGVEDALNGIAYKDDAQVMLRCCVGCVRPNFDTEVEIVLETFNDENQDFVRSVSDWVRSGLKRHKKRIDGRGL